LIALQHSDLKEMGLNSVGHRLTILKAVYEIKVKQNVPIDPDHYIPLCMIPSFTALLLLISHPSRRQLGARCATHAGRLRQSHTSCPGAGRADTGSRVRVAAPERRAQQPSTREQAATGRCLVGKAHVQGQSATSTYTAGARYVSSGRPDPVRKQSVT
jgi:hypothetical protein